MKLSTKVLFVSLVALLTGFGFLVIGVKADIVDAAQFNLTPDCQGCHSVIREHWEESAHGQSASNPAFQAAWLANDQPKECLSCHTTGYDIESNTSEYEAVACVVCHSPMNEEHPYGVMPTSVSSRDCGNCHIETLSQWESSVHANADLSCIKCHNSHTTELKTEGSQELCQSCHGERVHTFEDSVHSEKGLLCVDCHLMVSDTEPGEGHGMRSHTFTVSLETCEKCHENQIHSSSLSEPLSNEEIVEAGLIPNFDVETLEEPQHVSPVGFSMLGVFVGLAVGLLVSPWLERWYKKFDRGS